MSENKNVIRVRVLDTNKLPRDRWDRIVVYAWAYEKPLQEILHLYNAEYQRWYPSDAVFSLNEILHAQRGGEK